MHEPPEGIADADVLALVRKGWDAQVQAVEHLPVGFGGWHWRADGPDGPRLFVTLDQRLWHTAESLEATYAGALALAHDLDFVHAPLPHRDGTLTVPCGDGSLSCTRWVDGSRPEEFGAEAAELVRRLHRAPVPPGVPTWSPAVPGGLTDELADWVSAPWSEGPFGEEARGQVLPALGAVRAGLTDYLELCRRVDPTTFVATHGEPHVHNQWRAGDGRLLLLDWETLRLAPAARDMGGGTEGWFEHDPSMLRLFRLEWHLSEIRSFSDWLRGPHEDDADTRTALRALAHEIKGLLASQGS